ncbi:hypothetical protein D3C78_276840 [compost metagenome]
MCTWYTRQMAGTLAQPVTLLSNIASENDPHARGPNSILDLIKYRLPGLRQSLSPKLDALGEPMPNRTYPGGPLSIAAPIAQSQQTDDPVRVELGRLGWAPGKQKGEFTSVKVTHVLTPEQLHERDEITGQLILRDANALMHSKAWQALDKVVTKARNAVKVTLIPLVTAGKRGPLDRLKQAIQQREARK